MSIAFLFPGQGAQAVGMGASLAAGSPAAAAVFANAAEVLGFDLLAVCKTGPQAELDRTDIAQPAIYTVSCAALAAMREKGVAVATAKDPASGGPSFAAGLSLGEFTALHYAGVFGFEEGLRLVRERGRLMQAAADSTPGGMVSIIGSDEAKVRDLCREAAKAPDGTAELLEPANFLCPGNIVISGAKTACARAAELAGKFGGKAIPLSVAGAFHTAHMSPAAEGLGRALAGIDLRPPTVPVIGNATAKAHAGADDIRRNVVKQLDHAVLWEQSMRALLDSGVVTFYEIGPGRVLAGLAKRIQRSAKVINVQSAEDLAAL